MIHGPTAKHAAKPTAITKLAAPLSLVLAATSLVAQLGSQAAPQLYSYSGGPQIYVVPDGVTTISATLNGAQGGSPSGGGDGGLGATVDVVLTVNPGEVLMINVGGDGNSNGGWNGGGRGAGTGGGATDIRRPSSGFSTATSCAYQLSCGLNDRVVVAGGGGGGGWALNVSAAADGGDAGLVANPGASSNLAGGDATPGGGASTSAGLAGSGTFTSAGQGASAGTYGSGAASAWVANATGGGGGGGYFGGGSGGVSQDGNPQADGVAGGGGGSSWAGGSGVISATFATGTVTGNGSVLIDPPSAIPNAAFSFTGTAQFFEVPSDVQEVAIRLYGAGGGAPGDIVYGRLPVSASSVLQLNIGGRGIGKATDFPGRIDGEGGWNGGGNGNYVDAWSSGTGGGGASDIRICSQPQSANCSLSDRVVVAAGGGGGSYGAWGLGGGIGGANSNGSGANGSGNGGQGLGASLASGGGIGGSGVATSGSLGQGGSAGVAFYGTGGGGGGLFGGGGGNDSGGGGGSSCASATGACNSANNLLGTNNSPFAHSQGTNGSSADGLAIITAMPKATTGLITNLTSATASVSGTVNAKFLASTPTLFLDTAQAAVESCASPASSCTPSQTVLATTNSTTILAGNQTQSVFGDISGLNANTTYFYRICAQSVAGYACGAVSSFSTALSITKQSLANAVAGSSFTDAMLASGGSGTYTAWEVLGPSSLPSGLTLNSSSGVISGVPTSAGAGNFSIQVTDSSGGTTSRTISYEIAAPSPPPTQPPAPQSASTPSGVPPTISVVGTFSQPVNSNGTISLVGSNLAGASVQIVGFSQSLQVLVSSSQTLSFVVPSTIAPGTYSLLVANPFGTVLLPDVLLIRPKIEVQVSQRKFLISNFAPGSPSLTRPHILKLSHELAKVRSPLKVLCIGRTMGPRVLKSDLKLARDRAKNACAYIRKLNPLVSIKIMGETSREVGNRVRSVEISIEY